MNIIINIIFISSVTSRRPELRVIGGRDALVGEYPYAASLEIILTRPERIGGGRQVSILYTCSGAIITKKWTLTAAHCCDDLDPLIGKYVIRTGVKSITDPQNETQFRSHRARQKPANITQTKGNVFDVESMHMHPNYEIFENKKGIFKMENDIGLVKSKDICLERYAQISAVDHRSLIGLKATFIGYGYVRMLHRDEEKLGLIEPRTLQVIDVAVTKCDEYNVLMSVTPALCVSMKCDKISDSICPGDSGGPLFVDSRVVAVTSGGNPFKCSKAIDKISKIKDYSKARVIPSMTPVSPYLNWIANTISDK